MNSHIVNTQNSSYRFTIVRAQKKNPLTRRSTFHWSVVSEHMHTATCFTTEGLMPFKEWISGKTSQFAFQFTDKNQNRIWAMLQFLIAVGAYKHDEPLFFDHIYTFVRIAKNSPTRIVTSDEILMDYLSTHIPLLKPPEMISWELTLKMQRALDDRD